MKSALGPDPTPRTARRRPTNAPSDSLSSLVSFGGTHEHAMAASAPNSGMPRAIAATANPRLIRAAPRSHPRGSSSAGCERPPTDAPPDRRTPPNSRPERLPRLPHDVGSGRACLLDHGVDLRRRAHVVRERHTAPATAVLDALPSASRARSQSATTMPPAWKNTTSSSGPAASSTGPLVERAGASQISHSEGREADALLHAESLRRPRGREQHLGAVRKRHRAGGRQLAG